VKFNFNNGIFSFGKWQEFVTQYEYLIIHGKSIDDVIEYVEQKKLSNQAQEYTVTRKCKECDSPMMLYPVNTGDGDKTGDNSKTVWVCTNKYCMDTVYSIKTVREQTTPKGK